MTGRTTPPGSGSKSGARSDGNGPQAVAAMLQARWRALARREQTLVIAAGSVVALALLWWVALAPALQVLRTAPARHAALDAQLQHMQSLQAEAQQLQSVPRARSGDALRALQTSLAQQLGASAQLSSAGDRATVTLKGVPADALARWLTQARGTTRAVPLEARLTRSTTAESTPQAGANGLRPATAMPGATPAAPQASPSAAGTPRWDGTVVLSLPPT